LSAGAASAVRIRIGAATEGRDPERREKEEPLHIDLRDFDAPRFVADRQSTLPAPGETRHGASPGANGAPRKETGMIRRSTAEWRGDGMHGAGALSTQSGAFKDQPYSFKTRFESEDGKAGTNPEELLGAAHAGCFAMATAFALSGAGHAPEHLKVTAAVDLQKVEGGFAISQITLDLEAKIPGIDAAK
jgi:osmotically inducible protein OsmC